MDRNDAPQSGQKMEIGFSIEKLYLADASVEVPLAPKIFLERETPTIEVEFSNGSSVLDNQLYDCFVKVNVTAKLPDKRVLFIIEVKEAGIFQLRNVPPEFLEPILNVDCCNIIYPYLREVVSDLVVRAGFPPVYLSPLNFQSLYEQKKAAASKENQGAPATAN